MRTELKSGLTLAGRYELERPLGEGGMGSVWLARHTKTKKRVALKLLKPGARAAQGKRLMREARAAGVISHPNVREVFDVLEDEDGSPVIVMEYLEGRSLGGLLAETGKLSLERTAEILLPVISAVGTAHTLGIVHRDLKPDNVFLVERPSPCVKVVDFGIAKLTAEDGDAAETAALTGTGSIVGTPHYMAPEQVFGEKNLDHRVDVWALGLMAYRLLSGVLPTEADNVGQTMKIIVSRGIPPLAGVAPDVPADVAALVDRMLQRSTRARLCSLHEAYEVMKRYASSDAPDFAQPKTRTVDEAASDGPTTIGEAVDPHTFTQAPETRRSKPSRARVLGLAALATLGALGLLGGGALMNQQATGALAAPPGPSSGPAGATSEVPRVANDPPATSSASSRTTPLGAKSDALAASPPPPREASATADSGAEAGAHGTSGAAQRATAKPRASTQAPRPSATFAGAPAGATTAPGAAPTLTVQTAW